MVCLVKHEAFARQKKNDQQNGSRTHHFDKNLRVKSIKPFKKYRDVVKPSAIVLSQVVNILLCRPKEIFLLENKPNWQLVKKKVLLKKDFFVIVFCLLS